MSAPRSPTERVQDGTDPLDADITAYENETGGVGVRNRVLVMPSVICSHIVAERIADGTDGAICAPHDHGCGQIGHDHDQTERTLLNLARNPNVAGTTVVGLGCEHLQSGPFADRIAETGVPVRETAIQEAGGSDACIERGVGLTSDLASETNAERIDATLDDLTIGVVSSDLEASTREHADPLLGDVVDELRDAGARVAVAGTERLASHADAAIDRAATDEVADAMREAIDRYADRPGSVRRLHRVARERPLSEVMGTWGSGEVDEFLPYGARASIDSGLVLVDAPSRFEEAATALAAAGAAIVVHVTAEGIPTGHPVVPTLKVTGDTTTADVLADDIDVNARSATTESGLAALFRVADGGRTAAERHGLTKFAINRRGPSQ